MGYNKKETRNGKEHSTTAINGADLLHDANFRDHCKQFFPAGFKSAHQQHDLLWDRRGKCVLHRGNSKRFSNVLDSNLNEYLAARRIAEVKAKILLSASLQLNTNNRKETSFKKFDPASVRLGLEGTGNFSAQNQVFQAISDAARKQNSWTLNNIPALNSNNAGSYSLQNLWRDSLNNYTNHRITRLLDGACFEKTVKFEVPDKMGSIFSHHKKAVWEPNKDPAGSGDSEIHDGGPKKFFPPDFKPGRNDIITGIGKKYTEHEGNKRFLEFVASKSAEYLAANKEEKASILSSIVSCVRFVKLDHSTGLWFEVKESCARAKVSREFRDLLQNRNFAVHDYHDHAAADEADTPEDGQVETNSESNRRSGSFPLLLHAILDQVEADGLAHIISWQPHGRCFVVHKPKEFADQIMPLYFRTKKFSSFQRQLHVHGFCRLTRGPDVSGYYHELFLRGKTQLCTKMTRTLIKGTRFRAAGNPDQEPDFYTMPPVVVVPRHSD